MPLDEERCAYCNKKLGTGQIHDFIESENRFVKFCLSNCNEKYMNKIKEVEIMEIKDDLLDMLVKLGKLKADDPKAYKQTVSVLEDLSKVLEGTIDRVIKILQRLDD